MKVGQVAQSLVLGQIDEQMYVVSKKKIFLSLKRKFQKTLLSMEQTWCLNSHRTALRLTFKNTLCYTIGTNSLSKRLSGWEMEHSSLIRRFLALLLKQNKIKHIFFSCK